MKLYSTLLFASLLLSPSARADQIPVEDLELNEKGEFVSCILQDGRKLSATPWLVSVGNRILAKTVPAAYRTETADNLIFQDWEFKVSVYKQFCGREGYMGAEVTNHLTGKTQLLRCRQRNRC